jgi:hypothetical protein
MRLQEKKYGYLYIMNGYSLSYSFLTNSSNISFTCGMTGAVVNIEASMQNPALIDE